MMAEMVDMSILPPLITQTTFLSSEASFFSPATESAPAPSVIILCLSINSNIASRISESETVTTSSINSFITSKVRSPGFFTATPSAMVSTFFSSVTLFSSRDLAIQQAPSGSTPIILIPGFSILAAIAMPLINPPPPMGTSILSTLSSSLSTSSATVPCPSITSISSKGWTKT